MWSEKSRAGSTVAVPFAGVTAPLGFVAEGILAAIKLGGEAVRDLGVMLARWRIERNTLHELRALDEHMLRDIGLTRAMIDAVAYDHRAADARLGMMR